VTVHTDVVVAGSGWHSPVTVVADGRRVDLALPRTVPVGDLLPQVLALCDSPSSSAEPVRWALARLDGRELTADRCLDDADVRDGEVLTLHSRPTAVRPAYVEDVRDLVEDTVDAAGGHWTPRTTMGFTLLAGAAGLAAAALLPLLGGGPATMLTAAAPATGAAAAAVAAAGGVAAAWWAGRRRHPVAGYALAAAGCLWGGVAGARLAGRWELPTALVLAGAAAGVLATAAAARLVTRHAAGHLSAAAVLAAVATTVATAPAAGADALTGVRVAGPLLVLVIGAVPRIALTAGGLGLADYRVRHGGQLSPVAVAQRLRHSEVLLTGTLVGIAVAEAGLGLALATAPGTWDRWLGALTGLALVLRSRAFSRVTHVTPIRLAGALVLAGQVGWLAHASPARSAWLPALAVVVLLALVAVSAVALSDISRARVKQLLDATELVVVAAMLPVAAGALGGYRFAAGIIG
jgi:type VII secretion integral membrane protein EccD